MVFPRWQGDVAYGMVALELDVGMVYTPHLPPFERIIFPAPAFEYDLPFLHFLIQ